MTKHDLPLLLLIALMAGFLWMLGYFHGYLHVITKSEAHIIEYGDVIVLEVDGHGYEYVATPDFYSRIASYTP